MYLNLNDNKDVKRVAKAAFPAYNGRKFRVEFGVTHPINVRSYWDGGSKTSYAIVDLATNWVKHIPEGHPMFNKKPDWIDLDAFVIPEGQVLVSKSVVCGKNTGITIFTPATPLLESGAESDLTEMETNVLIVTARYKSSYAEYSDYRAYELNRLFGYTKSEIEATRSSLMEKGYMNRNKSINNKGRNAIANHPKRHSL